MTTIAKINSNATNRLSEQVYRRTKYDIWSDILESCLKTQRTKFWLTSRLRLSWKCLDETLTFLANGKLIEATKRGSETTKYKTTAKGQQALNAYKLFIEKCVFP